MGMGLPGPPLSGSLAALLRGLPKACDRFAVSEQPGGLRIRAFAIVHDAPVEQHDDPNDIDQKEDGFHSATWTIAASAGFGLGRDTYAMLEFNDFVINNRLPF